MSLCPHCHQNHAAVGAVPQASPYRSQVQRIYAAALAEQAQQGFIPRPRSFVEEQQLKARKALNAITAQQLKERAGLTNLTNRNAATGAPFLMMARNFRPIVPRVICPKPPPGALWLTPVPGQIPAIPANTKGRHIQYMTKVDVPLRHIVITSLGLQATSVMLGRNECLPSINSFDQTKVYDACEDIELDVGQNPAPASAWPRPPSPHGAMTWRAKAPTGQTIDSDRLFIFYNNPTGAPITPVGFVY